ANGCSFTLTWAEADPTQRPSTRTETNIVVSRRIARSPFWHLGRGSWKWIGRYPIPRFRPPLALLHGGGEGLHAPGRLVGGGHGLRTHPAHERDGEGQDREENGEQPEVVGVGEHLRLPHQVLVEHGHRLPLRREGVGAPRREVGRPLLEPRRRLRVPDIDVGRQHRLVPLAAPREEGG